MFTPAQSFGAALDADLSHKLDLAAEMGGDILAFNLSAESGPRTGTKYEFNPRVSSVNIALREFPQEQSGDLMRAAGWQRTGNPLTKLVGVFGDGKIIDLEYGSPDGLLEPRSPVMRTLSDPVTLQTMLNVMIAEGRASSTHG